MVVIPAEAPGASIAGGDRSDVPASPAPAPVVVQYAAAGPAPHTSAPASSAASAKARRRPRDIRCYAAEKLRLTVTPLQASWLPEPFTILIFGVFVPANAVSPTDRSPLIAVGACVSAKSAAVHPAAGAPAFVIDEIDAVTVDTYWAPEDPFVILNSMSWSALPGYMPDTVLVCVMVTAEAVPVVAVPLPVPAVVQYAKADAVPRRHSQATVRPRRRRCLLNTIRFPERRGGGGTPIDRIPTQPECPGHMDARMERSWPDERAAASPD